MCIFACDLCSPVCMSCVCLYACVGHVSVCIRVCEVCVLVNDACYMSVYMHVLRFCVLTYVMCLSVAAGSVSMLVHMMCVSACVRTIAVCACPCDMHVCDTCVCGYSLLLICLGTVCVAVTMSVSMSQWCPWGSLCCVRLWIWGFTLSGACVGLCDALTFLRGRVHLCWKPACLCVSSAVPASLCVTCTCPRLLMAVHLCM